MCKLLDSTSSHEQRWIMEEMEELEDRIVLVDGDLRNSTDELKKLYYQKKEIVGTADHSLNHLLGIYLSNNGIVMNLEQVEQVGKKFLGDLRKQLDF